MIQSDNRITQRQLELLQSFRYLTNESQIAEVKELLHLYFKNRLDAAIDKEEEKRNYTADIYQEWLTAKERSASKQYSIPVASSVVLASGPFTGTFSMPFSRVITRFACLRKCFWNTKKNFGVLGQ